VAGPVPVGGRVTALPLPSRLLSLRELAAFCLERPPLAITVRWEPAGMFVVAWYEDAGGWRSEVEALIAPQPTGGFMSHEAEEAADAHGAALVLQLRDPLACLALATGAP
jgi:hypothetical protein